MMPGIDFTEMIVLVIVAIVVIGPKDLPLMMRKFGQFTGKMRALAFEFRQGLDELGRQAELEELRKEVANLKQSAGVEDLQRELDAEMSQVRADLDTEGRAIEDASAATTDGEHVHGPSCGHDHGHEGEANTIASPDQIAAANGHEAHPYEGEDFRLEGQGPEPEPQAVSEADAQPPAAPARQGQPA